MTARHAKSAKQQTGSMLLEALIAILIFSMGILAVVGLLAASTKSANDAMYRTTASLLANDLIGQMWVSNRTTATLQTNFQGGSGTDGANYTVWKANVTAALPGVAGGVNSPTVTFDAAVPGKVTVGIFWKLPSEMASMPAHTYVTVAQIQ